MNKYKCKICGKEFEAYKNHGKDRLYCSIQCHGKDKQDYMRGKYVGKDNHNWKGGLIYTTNNRMFIYIKGHPHASNKGYLPYHRYVYEKYLIEHDPLSNMLEYKQGRLVLKRKYHVHHIDLDPTNHHPSNLMGMTNSDHRALHNELHDKELIKFTLECKERDIEKVYELFNNRKD